MTLLFMDGFDAQDTNTKWNFNTITIWDYTPPTRFGTGFCFKSSQTGAGSVLMNVIVPASARLYAGFAAYNVTTNAQPMISFFADSGAIEHFRLGVTATGALTLGRGATVVATSAAGVISVATWQYIEVTATISDTVGVMEARVNGVSVVSFTGDTKNAGVSTNFDMVQMWMRGGSGAGYPIDDLYICNDQGSRNNTWLGDVRVQTLRPNGAGSAAAMTPVGSGTNYQNVDEVPPSAADFNYSGTPGQQDLYAVEDIAAGTVAVLGVQVSNTARKTDTGARSIKNLIRAGGTTTASAALALSVTTDTYSTPYDANPTTAAAWDVADIAALEAGVEVV